MSEKDKSEIKLADAGEDVPFWRTSGWLFAFGTVIYVLDIAFGFLLSDRWHIFLIPGIDSVNSYAYRIGLGPFLLFTVKDYKWPPFNPINEVFSSLLNPGFLSGIFVGYHIVKSRRQTLLGLVPIGIFFGGLFLLLCVLSVIGGGPAIIYFPMLLFTLFPTLPYSILGAYAGWRLRSWLARRSSAGIGIILLLPFVCGPVRAWDEVAGRRHIVANAVIAIEGQESGRFREVNQFDRFIRDGAQFEDSPFYIVLDHFHNPVTQRWSKGIQVPIFSKSSMSLTQDGLLPVGRSSIERARRMWLDAQKSYKAGDKHNAYFDLGRVAHLITGDLYQPGHVHDDPHLPFWYFGDESSIESNFMINPGAVTALNPFKLSPTEFPAPLTSDGIKKIGEAAALITYKESSFFGIRKTNDNLDGTQAGSIQLPGGGELPITFWDGDSESATVDENFDHFEIPG